MGTGRGELGLPIAKEAQLKLLYPMADARRVQIADIAQDIASEIESGDFNNNLLNALAALQNAG